MDDQNLRKGKKLNKHTCDCCNKRKTTGNKKEPRYLIRALAFRKRVNYSPYHSVWKIKSYCLMWHIEEGPHVDGFWREDQTYIRGLSKWKKSIRMRNRRTKLDDWVNSRV